MNLLRNPQDINFCENWLRKAEYAYNNYIDIYQRNSKAKEFLWLCNGDTPTLGNAKFTYDLIQYGLSKSNTTKPRR